MFCKSAFIPFEGSHIWQESEIEINVNAFSLTAKFSKQSAQTTIRKKKVGVELYIKLLTNGGKDARVV